MLQARIRKVQKNLKEKKIDCLFITNPNNLFYLSSLENEDAYILITQNDAFYFTDSRYFDSVKNNKNFKVILFSYKKDFWKDFILHLGIKVLGFEEKHLTVEKYDLLQKDLSNIKFIKTNGVIEKMRRVKNDYELAQTDRACEISKKVFRKIEKNFSSFVTEKEVADFYEFEVRKEGASGLSFPSIVANGEGSAIPHYETSNKKIDFTKPTLIDIGCKYNGYCSDMTRMILPKDCDRKILEIHSIVSEAKEIATKMIKSGVLVSDLDQKVREFFKSKRLDKYFLHSLGHSVGIEVHDGFSVSSKSDLILEKGMVITIEPGLYFEGDFGVRLEDVVYVK